MDFSDLDGPSKASATKPGKFAPKGSKFRPKCEREAQIPSSDLNPAPVPEVKLEDSKLQLPPVATVYCRTDIEQPSHTVPPVSVKLDTEATEMEIDTDQQQGEEDHVVREIDVFFTSFADANSKLYVLQYPLRQRWRPYELEERCEKVRLEPETAEVELEMSAQVDSQNLDPDVYDAKAMPKQVLSTSWKPPTATGYAVGILMGNELHLNPVDAVVQLRPSMQHLKQPKKQSKTVPEAVNEQNKDTKEEEWIPLKYHGEGTQMSHRCMQNMVVKQEASHIQFSMTRSDYLDSLCPTSFIHKGPSLSDLLKLPLEDRFKIKLRKGRPIRFSIFKHIAPDSSIEDMFKVLRSHAQLVQGLWVAKSKFQYGEDVGKKVLFRDFVMLQFSKNPIVHISQLPETSEIMINLLNDFGRRRDRLRDWKLKEPTDDLFIKEYPNIVEEQKQIWDRVEPKIIECVFHQNFKHGIAKRRPMLSCNTDNVEKKTTIAPSSRGVMLDETREALPKALQKLFQAYKVCSLNQIRQRLRDMAVSENTLRKGTREARAAASAADASQEELLKTLNQVAVNIHGVFVSRSSPDHPQYDDFRNIVINLLLAEGPKGRLKRGSIEAAANMQLKRVPNGNEFRKVLEELCVPQNSAWVLKSGDGSPT